MRLLRLLIALFCLALPAAAQDQATLVADRVYITGQSVLIAEGNIEVFYKGARLTARRITFDRSSNRLTMEGPIALTDGEDVALFAEFADLSTDLQDGILTSARLVLDERLQLAAVEIARVGGRYTELNKVVASSCQVCPSQPVPLWSIRARRVIHDQEERQIYFENAQFRIGRIPVFYLPTLRMPDPTLDRARGFLSPSLRTTSQLGTGLKLPYFFPLGRSADVTVTPYLSAATTTIELRYRQAFRHGDILFNGAVSRDDILPGDTRAYLFGEGMFDMPHDFKLSFGLQVTSDDAYLLDYGYSEADRLESNVALTRVRRDEYIDARILAYHTLRDSETNSTQPIVVTEGYYEKRFVPEALGGEAALSIDTLTAYRPSSVDADGRDVARAVARLEWDRTFVLGPGVLTTTSARLTADHYAIAQDSAFDSGVSRLIPEAAVTLRWPLRKVESNGNVTHILEPVAMLAVSPTGLEPVPNEDSTLSEFDEGNLLSYGRYPGSDAYEEGLRLALGLNWTVVDERGRSVAITFGRLFRSEDDQFGTGTGLSGSTSDWLVAAQFGMSNKLAFTVRTLVDDDLSISKADLRMSYSDTTFDIETGFLYLDIAPSENRLDQSTEWAFDGTWRIDPNWSANADWRYDFEEGRATRAGLGVGFQNECVRVDLSLSRRFTSSTSVRPTTDFGLNVELIGFGTGADGGPPRRSCASY